MAFIGVAVAATVARWVLVGRMLNLPIRTMSRPFVTVMVPTAASMAVGLLVLEVVSPIGRIAALITSSLVTLAVSLLLLRLFAGGILSDALSVLPVPERHGRRVARWLRFSPATTT